VSRTVPPVATAIAAGLQVPWLRPVIVTRLAADYVAGGGTVTGLAARLGVSRSTVKRWLASTPGLRERLEEAAANGC